MEEQNVAQLQNCLSHTSTSLHFAQSSGAQISIKKHIYIQPFLAKCSIPRQQAWINPPEMLSEDGSCVHVQFQKKSKKILKPEKNCSRKAMLMIPTIFRLWFLSSCFVNSASSFSWNFWRLLKSQSGLIAADIPIKGKLLVVSNNYHPLSPLRPVVAIAR